MDFKDYLEKPVPCTCGQVHSVGIKAIEVEAGALNRVPFLLEQDGFQKPFILFDTNTYQAAGEKVLNVLDQKGFPYKTHLLEDLEPVPNETVLGRILMDFDPSCDLVMGIGSGTINDLSRFLSYQSGREYYIVATAPSMDGYASKGAALILDNLKVNFPCHAPRAILADLNVIAAAPQGMIAAGFGDVLGKYTCLVDWKLSSIITGEYYCDQIVQITKESLEKTIRYKDQLGTGDQQAVKALMEALITAGIAMSYAGSSRPASGSEHHLSHFWEMRYLLEERTPILHGTKVGIAAVLIAELYQYLLEEGLEPETIAKTAPPDGQNWVQDIKDVFLAAAPGVIRLEEEVQKNSVSSHKERIQVIAQHWTEITELLETLPPAEYMADLLQSVGAPARPWQVGIDGELVQRAILYAKEVRHRYTILQLLWDLDLLADYALRASSLGKE